MSYPAVYRTFDSVVVSGVTTGTEVDIEGGYQSVYILVPSGCVGNTKVFGAYTKGGTPLPLCIQLSGSATTGIDIASATSNKIIPLPSYVRFMTIVASTAPVTSVSYTIIGLA